MLLPSFTFSLHPFFYSFVTSSIYIFCTITRCFLLPLSLPFSPHSPQPHVFPLLLFLFIPYPLLFHPPFRSVLSCIFSSIYFSPFSTSFPRLVSRSLFSLASFPPPVNSFLLTLSCFIFLFLLLVFYSFVYSWLLIIFLSVFVFTFSCVSFSFFF